MPHCTRRQSLAFAAASLSTPLIAGCGGAQAEPAAGLPPDWGGGKKYDVMGGGGLRLRVREWGAPQGKPLLFLSGWSHAGLTWARQFNGGLAQEFRIVCVDFRGHGQSEKPMVDSAYTEGTLWADDVAAVMAALQLVKPVLIGSSYAGFVICDYIARHGQQNIGAINFVGAAVMNTRPELFGKAFGELLPGMTSDDLAINIDSTRRFIKAYYRDPLSADDSETLVASLMVVPPEVRLWCVSRTLDFTAVLNSITRPTLVTQGEEDAFVQVAMSDVILNKVRGAVSSRYAGVSHAPYFEYYSRFNSELAALARSA